MRETYPSPQIPSYRDDRYYVTLENITGQLLVYDNKQMFLNRTSYRSVQLQDPMLVGNDCEIVGRVSNSLFDSLISG